MQHQPALRGDRPRGLSRANLMRAAPAIALLAGIVLTPQTMARPRSPVALARVDIELVGPGLDTWNGKRISGDQELEARLEKLRRSSPHAVVNIRPYQPGNYNRLYQIALMLRRAGFNPMGVPDDTPIPAR